jgi:MFS family permease
LEKNAPEPIQVKGFSKPYWLYLAASGLIAVGFADFALIAFRFQKAAIVPQSVTPVLYSLAMAPGAISALVFGRLLDKFGLPILLLSFFLSALFAPLVFLGGFAAAVVGMAFWGIGMGAQDSLLKAVLVDVIPPERRSTAFGVFDTGFGIAWFAGSAVMGWLYDKLVPALVVFSVLLQLAALVFVLAKRSSNGR